MSSGLPGGLEELLSTEHFGPDEFGVVLRNIAGRPFTRNKAAEKGFFARCCHYINQLKDELPCLEVLSCLISFLEGGMELPPQTAQAILQVAISAKGLQQLHAIDALDITLEARETDEYKHIFDSDPCALLAEHVRSGAASDRLLRLAARLASVADDVTLARTVLEQAASRGTADSLSALALISQLKHDEFRGEVRSALEPSQLHKWLSSLSFEMRVNAASVISHVFTDSSVEATKNLRLHTLYSALFALRQPEAPCGVLVPRVLKQLLRKDPLLATAAEQADAIRVLTESTRGAFALPFRVKCCSALRSLISSIENLETSMSLITDLIAFLLGAHESTLTVQGLKLLTTVCQKVLLCQKLRGESFIDSAGARSIIERLFALLHRPEQRIRALAQRTTGAVSLPFSPFMPEIVKQSISEDSETLLMFWAASVMDYAARAEERPQREVSARAALSGMSNLIYVGSRMRKFVSLGLLFEVSQRVPPSQAPSPKAKPVSGEVLGAFFAERVAGPLLQTPLRDNILTFILNLLAVESEDSGLVDSPDGVAPSDFFSANSSLLTSQSDWESVICRVTRLVVAEVMAAAAAHELPSVSLVEALLNAVVWCETKHMERIVGEFTPELLKQTAHICRAATADRQLCQQYCVPLFRFFKKLSEVSVSHRAIISNLGVARKETLPVGFMEAEYWQSHLAGFLEESAL
eukprot:gnl/Chilomastix_cuspidata/245.p1 GENE.gnl/Chilomastix_cuspidata/245~~gnl/Chilomastix_cuspidata/245.p1  ORF type:complete len:697 (-),score=278.44 gnl/Chilomastix_cuspidata/245:1514-3604(-)